MAPFPLRRTWIFLLGLAGLAASALVSPATEPSAIFRVQTR